MKRWLTEIRAISPKTGSMATYAGPDVAGISMQDAQAYCERNGLGYCKVIGELIADIPCKNGTNEPDFKNMIDYEGTRNN